MQATEQQAILTVSMLAAFADGAKSDQEREQVKRIAESLDPAATFDLPRLLQDVLLERVDVAQAAAGITAPAHKQLAYEMAVCVCDADGSASAAEQSFLAELKRALGLTDAQTEAVEQQAGALAALPVQESAPDRGTGPGQASASSAPSQEPAPKHKTASTQETGAAPGAAPAKVPDAELERTILNAAILNGALELLPQSWASMAIIPLQLKLVYRVGQAHGYELDAGHAKEFVAAAGVGLTGQYLEQFGRKLLGGLFGTVAGGIGRGVGGAATGIAFSFATTYALGQLARRYYAGGRQMSTTVLRETYETLLGSAKQLQTQYLPQIEQRAGTLDSKQIVALVRNG